MRFKVSGSSCGLGGGFIKLLATDDEEVEEAGEALADEHDCAKGTGGVDVVCFAGLEGAEVESSLMPLVVCFVDEIGNGEGERLELLPLDEVDDEVDEIFSVKLAASKHILFIGWVQV